jgi:hypothetical protein
MQLNKLQVQLCTLKIPPSWHPGCEGRKSKENPKSGHHVEPHEEAGKELKGTSARTVQHQGQSLQHTSAKSAEDLEILIFPSLKSSQHKSHITVLEHVWLSWQSS